MDEHVAWLEGKRIDTAIYDDDHHLHLRFEDGSTCRIEGGGYDGLWTNVFVICPPPTRDRGE